MHFIFKCDSPIVRTVQSDDEDLGLSVTPQERVTLGTDVNFGVRIRFAWTAAIVQFKEWRNALVLAQC